MTDVKVDDKSVVKDRVANISFETLVTTADYEKDKESTNKTLANILDIANTNKSNITTIQKTIDSGVKSPHSLTIDSNSYDGSKAVEITTVKNTTGLGPYGELNKLYLVGGERTKSEINDGYGKTYTDEYTYIENGILYTKHVVKDEKGNDIISSEEIATKPYVAEEISKIVSDAPEKLDTLKEIADFISTDVTGSASFSVTGVYPIYHNISNGTLIDDATIKMTLQAGSLITINTIPSQSSLGKHFILDFPASKNIDDDDSWIYQTTSDRNNLSGYQISSVSKTINGTTYQYKRFKFNDTRNGEIFKLEVKLDSSLSSK